MTEAEVPVKYPPIKARLAMVVCMDYEGGYSNTYKDADQGIVKIVSGKRGKHGVMDETIGKPNITVFLDGVEFPDYHEFAKAYYAKYPEKLTVE